MRLDVDVAAQIVPLAIVIWSPSLQSCATCTVAIRKLWLPIGVTPSSFSVAAVDRHALADDVVVADLDAGGRPV